MAEYLDTDGHGSALLVFLSNAFTCIHHQLSIAKLNTYREDTNSLYFSASYILKKGNKEQGSMVLTVILVKFLVAFHKVLY